jgi:signal peptidase I
VTGNGQPGANGSTPSPNHGGLLSAVKSMLEIVVVALFLTTFLVQPFRIPSASMEPALRVGDFLLVDKQSFSPAATRPSTAVRRGDLIVFHWPVDPARHLVKRVVGLPGDRLRLRAGHVWIDAHPLAEPYAFYAPSRPNIFRDEFPSLHEADPDVEPAWWIVLRQAILKSSNRDSSHGDSTGAGELTVPPGEYFVLGDNRNDSEDSRYWGFVPRAAIVGRPLVVYFAVQPGAADVGHPWQRLRAALAFGLRSARVLR